MDYFIDNKQIGERLRTLRKKRGYKSQDAFAEAIDVTERKTIGKWETGEASIPIKKLAVICDVLDCDLDYLFGKIDTPKNEISDIMKQTGLSEKAANYISKEKRKEVLSVVLEDVSFGKLVSIIADCSDMENNHIFANAIAASVVKRGGLRFAGDDSPMSRLDDATEQMLRMIEKYNPTTLSKQLASDAAEKLFEEATKKLYRG